MKNLLSRRVQIGDWLFDVKMVRAMKVPAYGKPYSAIATMTVNGESIYVDSQLSRVDDELTRDDYRAIYQFCESIGAQQIHYDRMKNGQRMSKHLNIVRLAKLEAANR